MDKNHNKVVQGKTVISPRAWTTLTLPEKIKTNMKAAEVKNSTWEIAPQ